MTEVILLMNSSRMLASHTRPTFSAEFKELEFVLLR